MWLFSVLVQENLPDVRLKQLGLIVLAGEILRHSSIDAAMGLLVVTLKQICNKKEKAERGKLKEMYSMRRKGAPEGIIE